MAEVRRAILTDAERRAKEKLRMGDGASRAAMMSALKAQIALEEQVRGDGDWGCDRSTAALSECTPPSSFSHSSL